MIGSPDLHIVLLLFCICMLLMDVILFALPAVLRETFQLRDTT